MNEIFILSILLLSFDDNKEGKYTMLKIDGL